MKPNKKPSRPHLVRRSFTPVLLLVLAVALAALGGLVPVPGLLLAEDGVAGRPVVPALSVQTLTIEPADSYTRTRRALGRIEPARDTDVGFEVGGKVIRVDVDEGSAVDAGEVLAEQDTELLRARRDELVAALEQARARADIAERTRERMRPALAEQAISRQRFDEAVEAARADAAAVRRVEAQIASVDVELSKAVLVAPFDAVVAARYVDEGRVVAAGVPVVRLLERGATEARIAVPASDVVDLQVGERRELSVRGRAIEAVLEAIVPVRDRASRAVETLWVLAQDRGVFEGDTVALAFERRVEERGWWLPRPALTESARGLWACYVLEPLDEARGRDDEATHRLARRELEILHVEGERVFVRGALEPGRLEIVRSGLHKLVPELPVRLASQGADQ